eukprot:12104-Heterococcus_DN1.PRE.5
MKNIKPSVRAYLEACSRLVFVEHATDIWQFACSSAYSRHKCHCSRPTDYYSQHLVRLRVDDRYHSRQEAHMECVRDKTLRTNCSTAVCGAQLQLHHAVLPGVLCPAIRIVQQRQQQQQEVVQ